MIGSELFAPPLRLGGEGTTQSLRHRSQDSKKNQEEYSSLHQPWLGPGSKQPWRTLEILSYNVIQTRTENRSMYVGLFNWIKRRECGLPSFPQDSLWKHRLLETHTRCSTRHQRVWPPKGQRLSNRVILHRSGGLVILCWSAGCQCASDLVFMQKERERMSNLDN